MQQVRTRVLVAADERALAEVIRRGLEGLPGEELEVDLVLDRAMLDEQLRTCRYHLLVVGRKGPHAWTGADIENRVHDLPIVIVGEPSVGSSAAEDGRVERVPLPLSFNLLGNAVTRLAGTTSSRGEPELRRLRGTAG